uniref:Transcription elongation factor SPT4 n=1 Tax=Strigamia maritima TaxID=126957 RepID=T1IHW8_STRMM
MSIESVPPENIGNLRACLICSMIKSFKQFQLDGCDNCERYLRMKGDRDAVYDYTSANYQGFIAMMNPQDSWACKWQRINRNAKGIYAISVSGLLDIKIVRQLKSCGVIYKSRDKSTT